MEATPSAYHVVFLRHGSLDDVTLDTRMRCRLILQGQAQNCEDDFTNSAGIGVLLMLSAAQYFLSQSGNFPNSCGIARFITVIL